METAVKRLYEGLFLVDTGQAAADWDGIISAIETVLKRAEAEVVTIKKWDERKLAYDVENKSRGTYILVYFNGDTSKIGSIERDVQLSEKIMRVLILRTDKMSQEMIEKDVPSEIAEKRVAKAAEAAEKAQAEREAQAAEKAQAEEKAKAEKEKTEAAEEAPVEEKEPEAVEETSVESSEEAAEAASDDTEEK